MNRRRLTRASYHIGMTPGEAAGIPLGNGFRWKSIIEKATMARGVTAESEES